MRRLLLGLSCTILLSGTVAILSGALSLVETYGNSMAPRMSAGDLVIVRASDSYRVGDVVAYRSDELREVVLHRVTAIDDGRYTMRGDHNTFDDPEQPVRHQLIGKELLHVPGGGIWLDRLTSPTALGVIALTVLTAGGTAATTRRRRRRRTRARTSTMAQHAAPSRTSRASAGWPPRIRTTVTIAAATTAIGLSLGAVSWTRATPSVEPLDAQSAPTMTFSYHADVPPSPAYDDTRVTAPDPVFRNLTDQVVVRYAYRGEPGTASVAAELSTASGWHSMVPLESPATFDDTDHTATVRLDLDRLQARAQAAADAIGIPATQVDVTVVPTITTRGGETFAPELPFTLTPLQLSLVGGRAALTVDGPTRVQQPNAEPGTLTLAGRPVSVTSLRTASVVLTLGPLLVLCLIGLSSARTTSVGEATAIKRRYASLLLPVAPMTTPAGRQFVEVTDFPTLVRLAERYGLLVMHWSRSNVDTFIVHDDGITYRYRIGTGHTEATEAPAVPTLTPR